MLLTARTESCFSAIFAYIRENLSAHVTPNIIMADYSGEIQSALAYTFPEAAIKGYWYLYTNDVLAFVKQHDVQNQLARGHGSSALRMLLVLPLLPAEYMKPGLEATRKWAREKNLPSAVFHTCCDYVEQSWLRKIGAGRMSIFGLPHGVYNHLQTFNREVRSLLNTNSPLIWTVLESITQIATRTYVKCNKSLKSGASKQKSMNKSQLELDTIIRNATQMWIRTPVHLRSPLQFLQLASHCINDTVYYESRSDGKAAAGGGGDAAGASTMAANCGDRANRMAAASGEGVCRTTGSLLASKMPKLVRSESTAQSSVSAKPASTTAGEDASQPITSDPPPLAFFPRKFKTRHAILFSATQPPPLVPIRRRPNL